MSETKSVRPKVLTVGFWPRPCASCAGLEVVRTERFSGQTLCEENKRGFSLFGVYFGFSGTCLLCFARFSVGSTNYQAE